MSDVAERVQIGAAVVIDDALGVAGRARGVVERDRVPFVGRASAGENPGRRRRGNPRSRSRPAARPAPASVRIVDIDHAAASVCSCASACADDRARTRGRRSAPWPRRARGRRRWSSASSRKLSALSTAPSHRHADNAPRAWRACSAAMTATVSPRPTPRLRQRGGEPAAARRELRVAVAAPAMDDRRLAPDRPRPSAGERSAASAAT